MINPKKLLETKLLYHSLAANKVFDQFIDHTGQFADEPLMFSYSLFKKAKPLQIMGTGFSITSNQQALLKSVHELAERSSLFASPTDITFNYEHINNLISLEAFQLKIINNTKRLKVLTAKRLDNNKLIQLPIDLIFLTDTYISNAFFNTSVGTAGGFELQKTALKSITEIIEWDSALLWYFGIFQGTLIDLDSLQNDLMYQILRNLRWYKLNLKVVEVINDIGIPIYISFISDASQVGPNITCGTGVGIHKMNGFIHSIEEALHHRTYLRTQQIHQILTNKTKGNNINKTSLLIDNEQIIKLQNRLKKMPKKAISVEINIDFPTIVNQYAKKNILFYYVDITPQFLKKIDYSVIRIISPDLQPLYITSDTKILNHKRLMQLNSEKKLKKIYELLNHPFI